MKDYNLYWMNYSISIANDVDGSHLRVGAILISNKNELIFATSGSSKLSWCQELLTKVQECNINEAQSLYLTINTMNTNREFELNMLLRKINIHKIYLGVPDPNLDCYLDNDPFLVFECIYRYPENLQKEILNQNSQYYKNSRQSIKLNSYYSEYGTSQKINKIYLTGILPIPDVIKEKVEIVNIEKLWEELDERKKKEILNILNVNLEEVELLRKEKEKILLITQPLSEDGIINEEEKIDLYKEILLERKIKKVFIKPHPREKTNYIEVFKNIGIEVKVLPNEFPAEIFMLLDMNFKKVITIFSTAVLNFKYKYEIEFIGTKKYLKLYERFGDISLEE